MSFILRNISGGIVEINDLGITLEVAEDYNLSGEAPQDISLSQDLPAAITAAQLIILDPLDGVTPLLLTESLNVIAATNLPNYRTFGTTIDQLDDVSAPAPIDEYVLTYVTANSRWEPKPSTGGGSGTTCFPFYRANGTLDKIDVVAGLFPFYRSDGTQDNINMSNCV